MSPSKTVQQSAVTVDYTVEQTDLNRYGIMHGGKLLTLCDETGYLAARRHAECDCLTRAVHDAEFLVPAHAGDRLKLQASIGAAGQSSLWVQVLVKRESELTIMHAVFVYTAIDLAMHKQQVPKLVAEDDKDRDLMQAMQRLRNFVQSRP